MFRKTSRTPGGQGSEVSISTRTREAWEWLIKDGARSSGGGGDRGVVKTINVAGMFWSWPGLEMVARGTREGGRGERSLKEGKLEPREIKSGRM